MAGLIKTVLMVKHGKIPPSLHFQKPNPRLGIEDSPFYVNTELRDWPGQERPGVARPDVARPGVARPNVARPNHTLLRRAGVSSFGIGGANAHIIVEQPPPEEELGNARPSKGGHSPASGGPTRCRR